MSKVSGLTKFVFLNSDNEDGQARIDIIGKRSEKLKEKIERTSLLHFTITEGDGSKLFLTALRF